MDSGFVRGSPAGPPGGGGPAERYRERKKRGRDTYLLYQIMKSHTCQQGEGRSRLHLHSMLRVLTNDANILKHYQQ